MGTVMAKSPGDRIRNCWNYRSQDTFYFNVFLTTH